MIKISSGSGKLENILSINTNTLSNEYCQKQQESKSNTVCKKCYSIKSLSTYRQNCAKSWESNSIELSQFFLEDREIPIINSAFFRFHSHGELINDLHFSNLLQIAEKNHWCKFSLWTKRKDIVNRQDILVDNLTLIYSYPLIVSTEKQLEKAIKLTCHDESLSVFDKMFIVTDSDEITANCTGKKCMNCLVCYDQKSSTDIIIEKLK